MINPGGLAAPATRLAKDPKTSLILNGSRLIEILVCSENPIRVYRMMESAKLAR